MRYFLLLTLLSGCGVSNDFCDINGTKFNQVCDTLGYQPRFDEELEQDRRLDTLDKRLDSLESALLISKVSFQSIQLMTNQLDNQIEQLTESSANTNQTIQLMLDTLNLSIQSLTISNSANSAQINTLTNYYNTFEQQLETQTTSLQSLEQTLNYLLSPLGPIQSLQNTVNSHTIDIATLQGYNNIISIIDPCGDNVSKIDEVFLRLSDGKLLASFSDSASGLNTRFSLIQPSNTNVYITTDGSSCSFKVPATGINSGKVCFGYNFNNCL